ncbi:MAG: thiamine phosphate synthase [Christensenellales bacterium]|jgi:thiamine-phosphate pyrophosphorylase
MKPDIDYTLYLITDRTLMCSATIEESVEEAVKGGCTLVQLREKEASSKEFFNTAVKVHAVTARLGVPLIINDRIDIALAVGAEGVHVGQDDMPAQHARRIIGKDKILGVSASNLSEAMAAVSAGADYLGVGAMYATGTKSEAQVTTMEELKRIRERVNLPIVVIGGINQQTIPHFYGTGIDGLAVVSSIVAQPDVAKAARVLKELFLKGGSRA